MPEIHVKICGLKNAREVEKIDALGVDYLGHIFFSKSPRNYESNYSPSTRAKKVGVFVHERPDVILKYIDQYHLDIVQLHGQESKQDAEFLSKYTEVWKAVGIGSEIDLHQAQTWTGFVQHVLLDTKGLHYGGNGKTFDWSLLDGWQTTPPILAGGITPNHWKYLLPLRNKIYGIDLNSGFEDEPGIKNTQALTSFLSHIP